jgi:F-type H+-transporting ATPase subunit delta
MAADRKTVARPYAKAAFEDARESGRLAQWSTGLAAAAEVVRDPRVEPLLDNPRVTAGQLTQLLTDIAGPSLGDIGRNFVAVVAENHRLGYLPEISALFDELKDEAQGVADVTVTSASPLDDAQQREISEALARRLARKIRLHCRTDASLIGGAVLRTGDLVIDGSLRARLERLAYELTS